MNTRIVILLVLAVAIGVGGVAEAQKPLLLGGSVSLSGKFAKNGEYQRQAWELWVEHVNARGGLLGRPVELKVYDDRSDPATGARLYEKLVTEDRVALLMGPYSSPITAAVATVAEKHRMAMVAPVAVADEIWQRGYRFVFQLITPGRLEFPGTVDLIAQYGLKSMAITGEDGDYPRNAIPATVELAEKRGIKVHNLGYYPRATKDYSAIVLRAKAAGAEAFVCACYSPDSIQLTRQSKEMNYNAKMFVLSVGPALPDFLTTLGKDSEYIMSPDHWDERLRTPGNPEFVAAFTKRFAREPNYNAAGGYGGMQVLEAAVKAAGSLDQEKLREALLRLDTVTVFGRYKVAETGAQVGKELFIVQWQKGKKEIIWPADLATAKPMLPTPAWSERQ